MPATAAARTFNTDLSFSPKPPRPLQSWMKFKRNAMVNSMGYLYDLIRDETARECGNNLVLVEASARFGDFEGSIDLMRTHHTTGIGSDGSYLVEYAVVDALTRKENLATGNLLFKISKTAN